MSPGLASCKMGNSLPSRTLPCALCRHRTGRDHPPPEQTPCPQGLPACSYGGTACGHLKRYPPFLREVCYKSPFLLSHPGYLCFQNSGVQAIHIVMGSGNDGKDCNDTKAALPVSTAPSDSYSLAEAGGTTEAEEISHSFV